MGATSRGVVVIAVMAVTTACGSTATPAEHRNATTTSTVRGSAPGDVLVFREVLASFPYADTSDSPVPESSIPSGSVAPSSCNGGRLLTPPTKQTADASVVLTDTQKALCYLLGPTLLTGHNVTAANALYDGATDSWVVNIHFGNDDFVEKVASVELNKEIAIIVDGVVESAPIVHSGITGRDVQISGAFRHEAAARHLAAILDPSSASRTPTTPTTTIMDTMDKRCKDIGPGLGFDANSGEAVFGTSRVTVEMARSALKRAHQPVPASLANVDGREKLALCEFAANTPTTDITPTTVCPNGDRVDVTEPPTLIMYAVDSDLTATKLPGAKYLVPEGTPLPPELDPSTLCSALAAP